MNAPGRLTIYLGYAAGVGKTYRMLLDARRLREEGRDVVIGYFEPHGRADTIALTRALETVPRRTIEYRGCHFEEMDTAAILQRHPAICAVDEFPHTNVPGSENGKRWEDVQALLAAGIDVLTTMNIQHLESLNDQVARISGVQVRETIPDWVVQQAAEVVLVDLPPRALLNRLERGVVYSPEKAAQALRNFFRESTLVALRELAMRQVAHEVESRSEPVTAERTGLLVVLTPEPAGAMLIRRARRLADYLGAECFAIVVRSSGDLEGLPEHDRATLEKHLNFARNLHIETRILAGRDEVAVLLDFARRNGVKQIFLTRSRRQPLFHLRRDLVESIVACAPDMQIVIVGVPKAA